MAVRLIEFIARCLLRLQNIKYGDDYQAIFVQLGQSMKALQGFLLLHPAGRTLFSMPCNMEVRSQLSLAFSARSLIERFIAPRHLHHPSRPFCSRHLVYILVTVVRVYCAVNSSIPDTGEYTF